MSEGEKLVAHRADLELCAEALARSPEALRKVSNRIDAACARVMPAADADEVAQRLRVRLLSPIDGSTAKLGQYKGRASLGTWLRVIAAREALRSLTRPDVARRDEWEIEEFCDPRPASGTLVDRETYTKLFKEAFQQAFGALSIHERTILRQHYRDGIAISKLATVRQVHRGTLARELARVRHRLDTAVSSEVSRSLGICLEEQRELRDEMISQLDVSLSRLFREVPG